MISPLIDISTLDVINLTLLTNHVPRACNVAVADSRVLANYRPITNAPKIDHISFHNNNALI